MDVANTIVRGNTAGRRQVRNFQLHAQISMFVIHDAVEKRHEPASWSKCLSMKGVDAACVSLDRDALCNSLSRKERAAKRAVNDFAETARSGGAIAMTAGKLLLANTPMDDNHASASGGAVYVAGGGHLQV